jgi:hypothetical protein
VIQRILRQGDVGTTRKSYIKVRNMKVEDAMANWLRLLRHVQILYSFRSSLSW